MLFVTRRTERMCSGQVKPERVIADPIYGTRANRGYLKQRGIHIAGKPLGRPKQVTDTNCEQLQQAKAQRRQDYLQRIPIEGKFGQGKKGYWLNDIRAKRANTSSYGWFTEQTLMTFIDLHLVCFHVIICADIVRQKAERGGQ